jgi:octaprenyl-diphosphate synthase
LYGPIADELGFVRRVFDDELASEYSFVDRLCDRVRSYRGKMLRPALLLLAGKASGELCGSHRTLAAVVEMVHMATLVHDDVLDEAGERRRQQTICATSGNVTAVLLGDYLISHAFHLCSSLDDQFAARQVGATTNVVCEGELLQNRLRGNDRLSESTYFEIIRRKTGALTAVSCELGAHYGGADPPIVEALSAFGMSAGVAFQIVDDVLDITGDSRVVGKTVGRDLRLGKLTLPTLHCLRHAEPEAADGLRAVLAGRRPCENAELRHWLDSTGSIAHAVSVARDQVEQAVQRLERLPPSDARFSLAGMAQFVVQRRF